MCSSYEHWHGPRRAWWFILGLPFMILFLAVGSFVLMLLWNWLLPALFGMKMIGFWQAVGLLILSRILFGGIHGRPRHFYGYRRHSERWRKWHGEEEDKESPSEENKKAD